MRKKIAVILTFCFVCLGTFTCKSPEAPEEPGPNYEYRLMEVIYTSPQPVVSDNIRLLYSLYDPEMYLGTAPYRMGDENMFKIGENKYKAFVAKVFIQNEAHPTKHEIRLDGGVGYINFAINDINIPGAYELEMIEDLGVNKLRFKMSKD